MQSTSIKTSFTSINPLWRSRQIISWLVLLFLLIGSSLDLSAQYRRITVGAGIAPFHRPGQTDFTAQDMPYDIYAAVFQGNLGLRLDYNWHSSYVKERFSTTQNAIEVSLQYSLRQLLRQNHIDPYARLGATKWRTILTTEGYPGITDYELKIEEDKGYGIVGAIGANYLYKQFSIGLEAQFAKQESAQFIAGGFEPQPLSTDQFRFMVTASYTFSITSDSQGGIVYCPSF